MNENTSHHLEFVILESESISNSCSDQLESTKKNHPKGVLDPFRTLIKTIIEKNPQSKAEQHPSKSVFTEQAGRKIVAGDGTLVAMESTIFETEKEEGTGRFSECDWDFVEFDSRSESENSVHEEDYEVISSWLVCSNSSNRIIDLKMNENAFHHLDFITIESESIFNSCSDQLESSKNHQKDVLDRFRTLIKTITEKNPQSKTEQHASKYVFIDQAKVPGRKFVAGEGRWVAMASIIFETEKDSGGRLSGCDSDFVECDSWIESENSDVEEDYEEIESWLVCSSDSCSDESEYSSDSYWEYSSEMEMCSSCEESCYED